MKFRKQVTQEMKEALARVAGTQERFWDALRDFEQVAGVSLDSTRDYIDYTEPSDDDVRDVCENCSDGDLVEDGEH